MTEADELETSPVYFAEEVLGLALYPWQDKALTLFEAAPKKMVKVTISTPNGAGKTERVVAPLVLWWMAMHPQGKVIITTKSYVQLETQIMPAIWRHRAKFEKWKFIQGFIETPTGGMGIFFVTDAAERAEGHHPVGDVRDGPLLVIVDEAKSIPEDIMQALDRNNYSAILYVSSPGMMHGAFWESHTRPELGFTSIQVGLADCPHISEEKKQRIVAKYGERHPFTLSTLFGMFMADGFESKFDFEGLQRMQRITDATHSHGRRGIISEHGGTFTFRPQADGWAWIAEEPRFGLAYLAFADPAKGEQSEGSARRDTHACGILREGFLDGNATDHPTELVAAIYVEDSDAFSGAACRWELSVLAHRLWLLAGYYGECTIVPEENNYGGVLIKELLDLGADVWQREDMDHERKGRKILKYGYQTNSRTKRYWIEELAKAIFEETFVCRFKPAVAQLAAFIQNDDGTCEARPGAFDDFVAGIGIGLTVGAYKRLMPPAPVPERHHFTQANRSVMNRAVS